MNKDTLAALCAHVLELSLEAGRRIMAIYQEPQEIITKEDDSPLTKADLASHRCLVEGLGALTPDIPVLSEESSEQVKAERAGWATYWLIDPLDGTKEFIKRNGEFTVNVALIDKGVPVMGVVHAPALDTSYWGVGGHGAWMQEGDAVPCTITVAQNPGNTGDWKVVGSRSHQSTDFAEFMQTLPGAEVVSMGSSLKLCLVAAGQAHLYPRLGPTCEWDTAAAQAVVEAAGGQVLAWPGLEPLRYNRNPDSLLNPWFIVCSVADRVWTAAAR